MSDLHAIPAAEYVPATTLAPWKSNPRRNDEASKSVAASIVRFGFGNPILARRDGGEVIAGHTRLKAVALLPKMWSSASPEARATWHAEAVALATKPPMVPVRYMDLTETEAHALALADNKLGELADWDDGTLAEALRELEAAGAQIDDLGFDEAALREMLGGADEVPDDGPPAVEDGPAHSVAGEVYSLGPHRLVCGDSYDPAVVAKLLGGVRPAVLMTDPPYGIDASKMTMGSGQSDKARADRLSSVAQWDSARPDVTPFLAAAEWQCIWGGNYFTDSLPPTNHWLCWHKKNDGRSFSEFELAWTNYGKQARHLSHHWSGEVKEHITQKPLPVVVWALHQCPNQTAGAAVYDPFGGSGTTLLACAVTGRVAYLSELSPHYCDVIRRRWTRWAKDAGVDPGPGALADAVAP